MPARARMESGRRGEGRADRSVERRSGGWRGRSGEGGLTGEDEGRGGAEEAEEGGGLIAAEDGRHGCRRGEGAGDLAGDWMTTTTSGGERGERERGERGERYYEGRTCGPGGEVMGDDYSVVAGL